MFYLLTWQESAGEPLSAMMTGGEGMIELMMNEDLWVSSRCVLRACMSRRAHQTKREEKKKLLRPQLLCLNGRTLIWALSHSSTWPSVVGIFSMAPPGAVPHFQSSSALSCTQAHSHLTGSIIEPLRTAKGDLSSLSSSCRSFKFYSHVLLLLLFGGVTWF